MLSVFVVNSLADSHDANPGDGIAADDNGFTTLRAALEEANALVGADTITLPTGTITLDHTSGPLPVSDNITIHGTDGSQIDGTAFAEAFSIFGSGQLRLDQVNVSSSGPLVGSLRPTLLTTNARQADLIVAFSATPSAPVTIETKISNSAPNAISLATFDPLPASKPLTPLAKPPALTATSVPTPEEAIDQIINALFRDETDFVLPVSAEAKPKTIDGEDARPVPMADSTEKETPPKPATEPLNESMSLESDSTDEAQNDETVSTILRGWATEAGWSELDFLTRDSLTPRPRRVAKLAMLATALLGGVFSNSLPRIDLPAWQSRFRRLRRRAW